MTKKRWKELLNLPEDTGRVVVYCKENEKEEWAKEADEKGYRSRSSYLYGGRHRIIVTPQLKSFRD
ncbi:MAG: hypothetical protein ABEJ74_07005, partial [Haloferacaceae archaeon]